MPQHTDYVLSTCTHYETTSLQSVVTFYCLHFYMFL